MAIQNEPTRIQIPFADSGTKNVIPDTNSTPSASQAASWTDGFPAQCSLPLSAGGIPPARADFNGIFNTMTQSERFTQEGGVWAWDATVDYGTSRVVLGSDGLLYWSIAQSGPNVGGAQDPTADAAQAYWNPLQTATAPMDDVSGKAVTTQWIQNQRLSTTIYVDAVNGNDANDGLTSATALKTIDGFVAYVGKKFPTKSTVTVNLAAGSYSLLRGVADQAIQYIGASGVTIAGCAANGNNLFVSLGGQYTSTSAISANRGAMIAFANGLSINFSNVTATNLISANACGLIYSATNASISLSFTGCTVSGATVQVSAGSAAIFAGAESWGSGGVTGKRYSAVENSILLGIGSPTAIPGTVAGTVDSTSSFS